MSLLLFKVYKLSSSRQAQRLAAPCSVPPPFGMTQHGRGQCTKHAQHAYSPGQLAPAFSTACSTSVTLQYQAVDCLLGSWLGSG